MNALELLADATRLTEALMEALDNGDAGPHEILSTLQRRERLLFALHGLAPSTGEREAVAALNALDDRLMQTLDARRRIVASQLVKARTQPAAPPSSPRLVQESA